MRKAICLLVFLAISVLSFIEKDLKPFHINGQAQGTTYSITYYAEDSVVSKKQIDSILHVIDLSMSLYDSNSLISKFNQPNSKSLAVDTHFVNVLQKSFQINRETNGLFDITIQPLMKYWKFFGQGETDIDSVKIKSMLIYIGMDKLTLKQNKVSKSQSQVQIDLNGIAQGYSVDVLADFIESKNIKSYIVEVGGEIRAKGPKPDGKQMNVGIEGIPVNQFVDGDITHILSFNEGAVTTSGSYRKFKEVNGQKFGHIINPKTGYAIQNNVISVTVYAKTAIDADGYDNALMLMGVDKAIDFVNQRKDLATYIIYKKPSGEIADTLSTRMKDLMIK